MNRQWLLTSSLSCCSVGVSLSGGGDYDPEAQDEEDAVSSGSGATTVDLMKASSAGCNEEELWRRRATCLF